MNVKKLLLGALGVKALATVIILLITLLPLTSAQEYDTETFELGEAVISGEAVITGTQVLPSTLKTVELGKPFELAEDEGARVKGTTLSFEVLDLDPDEATLAVSYVSKPIILKSVVKGQAVTQTAATQAKQEQQVAIEQKIIPYGDDGLEVKIPYGDDGLKAKPRPIIKKAKIEIKEGEHAEIFGFIINLEKTNGETGVFSVKRIINPRISVGAENLNIQLISEGTEKEIESFEIRPGGHRLRIRNLETHSFEEISADLEEGISIPVGNRNIKIKSHREKIKTYLEDGETVVSTQFPIVTDMKGLYIKYEDGEKKLIKVMPSTAAERAKEVLGQKFDEIEIKDIGKPVYEARKEIKGRMFGLFPMKMQYRAQIDAESGDVVVKKPWYHFLASPQGEE